MERLNTTMRAARYLLGAGTFAAAMLALTASPALAQTDVVCQATNEGDPVVCGHVFTDGDGDHKFDSGEGSAGTVVVITDSEGNAVANSPTPSGDCLVVESCGYYGFVVFGDGDYYVCIVTSDTPSQDCSTRTDAVKVTVPSGDGLPDIVDFELEGQNQQSGPGTGTPGYWKNHPEAWPGPVTVGSVTYGLDPDVHPNFNDAIKLMGKVAGDKTYSMFSALLSAKLNVAIGNDPTCISPQIADANAWMVVHPVGSNVKASSAAWAEPAVAGADSAGQWHQDLDDYNNGKLCAPHRD